MWITFFVLLACDQPSWGSAEDCRALRRGSEKDDCWSVHLADVFETNKEEGVQII